MGLDFGKWRFRKMLIQTLKDEFGISEDDLKYLPEAVKIVKEKPSVSFTPDKKSEEEKAADKLKMTPQEMVAMFAGDVEDFH